MKTNAFSQTVETLLASGQFTKAHDLLVDALEKDPSDPEVYYLLGDVLCKLQRFEDAITSLQKADRLLPRHPRIYHLLGWAIFMNGDNPAGRAFMEVALKVDHDNVQLMADLAVLEMNECNFDKTREYILRARKIDPNDEMLTEIEMVAAKMERLSEQVNKKSN